MDFRKITDDLFARVTADDFAREAKVSGQTVRQARLQESANAHRSPPPGWEKVAARLAERQAAHFAKLAARLKASE